MSDIQKNATPGRPKGCLNYPPEFKQRLVAESCKPGGSIFRLALDNGINASLLFKWHQLWRQGKLQLPSGAITSDPLLIPVTIEPETAPVTEAACMAHTRRKIHDVHVRHPTAVTTEALNRIGALYAVKSEIRGSPAEERLTARKARSVPLMQSLYDWIQQQMCTLSRHSDTAKAFTCLLKQWDALNEYCCNGWVEIDNNLCENALRVVTLGRRSYMFFGSDGSGDSAAVIVQPDR